MGKSFFVGCSVIALFIVVGMLFYTRHTYQNALPRSIVLDHRKIKLLKESQTYDDVRQLLGIEPGDYSSKTMYIMGELGINIGRSDQKAKTMTWQDDVIHLIVQFDSDGRLAYAVEHVQNDGSFWHVFRGKALRDE